MTRLFHYFARYSRLSEEAKEFLSYHGIVASYAPKSVFVRPGEVKHKWCFVLEGLIGMELHDSSGKVAIEQILAAHDHFSGSKHPFSTQPQQVVIAFYEHSTLYELPNSAFREAVDGFAELQLLYHILKQQQINKQRLFIRMTKIPKIERVAYLHRHFPAIATRLTVKQIFSLLGYTTPRQYYAALQHYLRQR